MNIAQMCQIFNFKSTKEIEKNTKVRQLVGYINQNQIEFEEIDGTVLSKKSFLIFLNNINSIEVAARLLGKYRNLMAIEQEPEKVANFFNTYSVENFTYPGEDVASLLLDKEYLKYASVEWTREHVLSFSFGKVLQVSGKKVSTTINALTDENEDEYIPNVESNIEALKKAQKNKVLKKAIESLA